MRRDPAGVLECLRTPNVHFTAVIARIPNVLPSRTHYTGYTPPLYPGYTLPYYPSMATRAAPACRPAQRLADSVKMVITGTPTYRHASTPPIRHASTPPIRHATIRYT